MASLSAARRSSTWISPSSESRCGPPRLPHNPRSLVQAISSGLGLCCGRWLEHDSGGRSVQREQVRFTGIDMFEMRPATSPGLSLKAAHSLLTPTGARVPTGSWRPVLGTVHGQLTARYRIWLLFCGPGLRVSGAWRVLELVVDAARQLRGPRRTTRSRGPGGNISCPDLLAIRLLADAQTPPPSAPPSAANHN